MGLSLSVRVFCGGWSQSGTSPGRKFQAVAEALEVALELAPVGFKQLAHNDILSLDGGQKVCGHSYVDASG